MSLVGAQHGRLVASASRIILHWRSQLQIGIPMWLQKFEQPLKDMSSPVLCDRNQPQSASFGGERKLPMRRTAGYREPIYSRNKTYLQTEIGDLRKRYGADFAQGCDDDEKIADVVRKLPSLRAVILHQERKQFEGF